MKRGLSMGRTVLLGCLGAGVGSILTLVLILHFFPGALIPAALCAAVPTVLGGAITARHVALRNRELRNQMDLLQQEHAKQDQFRSEFTANVSHELKTPLTSISGFAEIIRDGMVRQEDIPRFAGNIYREAQRLITLVGDIIKISQMDDKQVPIQRERLDLLELCRDVLDLLEPSADAAGVRCYLEGQENLPPVWGAQQIADEMIYNLCDNAIKYNRSGGIVRVRVTGDGDRAVSVTVEDTGIGIPPEHRDRVFERFYRVDKNRSKEKGGTGLGLSIVKHGALYHGAALKLESEPGVGTRITVTFPTGEKGERL